MKTPNTIEDEIDRIRLAIYEETKYMTPEQCAERRKRNTEVFVKECGYRLVPNHDSLNSMRLEKLANTPQ